MGLSSPSTSQYAARTWSRKRHRARPVRGDRAGLRTSIAHGSRGHATLALSASCAWRSSMDSGVQFSSDPTECVSLRDDCRSVSRLSAKGPLPRRRFSSASSSTMLPNRLTEIFICSALKAGQSSARPLRGRTCSRLTSSSFNLGQGRDRITSLQPLQCTKVVPSESRLGHASVLECCFKLIVSWNDRRKLPEHIRSGLEFSEPDSPRCFAIGSLRLAATDAANHQATH